MHLRWSQQTIDATTISESITKFNLKSTVYWIENGIWIIRKLVNFGRKLDVDYLDAQQLPQNLIYSRGLRGFWIW